MAFEKREKENARVGDNNYLPARVNDFSGPLYKIHVVKLQSIVRMLFCRKKVRRHLAARKIQAVLRRTFARATFLHQRVQIVKIQAFIRMA